MAGLNFSVTHHKGEGTVIGCNENVVISHERYYITLASYPRVNHDHVNASLGKGMIAGPNGDSSGKDIVRFYGMGQVNDPGSYVPPENGTFDLADERVLETKISCQGNQVDSFQELLLFFWSSKHRNRHPHVLRVADVRAQGVVLEFGKELTTPQ